MNKVSYDMTYAMHSAGCIQIIPHVQSEEYDCDDQVSTLTSEGMCMLQMYIAMNF